MPTILTLEQVADADMADLLATYEHFAGRSVARFSSRAVAERRTKDAIMSSADTRGHLGVPKHTTPQPTSAADLVAKAAETGRADARELAREGVPGSREGVEAADPPRNPYPEGSLAARLWAEADGNPLPPAAPPPPPPPAPGAKPRPLANGWIQLTAKARKGQGTSLRSAVYNYIEAAGRCATVDSLVTRFGPQALGCVSILKKEGYAEAVENPKENT